MQDIDLRLGNCYEIIKTLDTNSIDSVVTDPPYGFKFMGNN
jgi:site-specific DNA-methyltransferase (adenine-specific)